MKRNKIINYGLTGLTAFATLAGNAQASFDKSWRPGDLEIVKQ